MPLDLLRLRTMIAGDEGLRLKPYKDTAGKTTIGFGRNLDDVGLSQEEALVLLDNDIRKVIAKLPLLCPWWSNLDPVRQLAIADMAYNIGAGGVQEFSRMIEALKNGDWDAAAREMLASRWALQVGARAQRLARIIVTGKIS